MKRSTNNLDLQSECIAMAKSFGGDIVLAKNRDRNYNPEIKIVKELTGYGVELCYIVDVKTDWSEGMNDKGIAIINSALFVHRDEKEKKLSKKQMQSKDGIRIREALAKTNLADVIDIILSFHGGVKGHTLVTDGKKLVSIEQTSRNKPVIKNINIKNKPFVRTNHGVAHPEAGYQRGKDRFSSVLRMSNAIKVINRTNDWEKLVPNIYNHKQDLGPKFDLVRNQNKLWTSCQFIMNVNKQEMILYLIPKKVKFLGIENKIPKDYKSKINVNVKYCKKYQKTK